ncbi:branched-chain amino acid transport system ATP-binding protein [Microvirga flocculans]|uniref:Branched-chain amino acid transport system ATP-binding protein n=1 Tax=Microvirga flocculans TaxID=217168 RepID=A0A7W6IHW4_9HYPH|nr:ABC transporter ATP-binding protein [Microvirga flocculans]MBB4041787.1 branched-chain amino acid transport system ATP-binding protein [Microvirga flocculans]
MLTLKDVDLAYGPIAAVRKASIEVAAGEVVAIVGGNGAGKSTLLKGIAGLMPVGSGQIVFDGEEISRVAPHRRVARGIALSPEGRQVFPDQTVYDNLTLGAYFRHLPNDALDAEVEEQFKLFPRLRERRDQLAVTLSGGEQQMLAIARALMGKPRLLLLDEPSLGLAPKIIQEIFEIIVSLRRSGITILLVEQMANMALAIADRAYVLETGSVTLSGTGQQLLHDPKVRAAYLGGSHGAG